MNGWAAQDRAWPRSCWIDDIVDGDDDADDVNGEVVVDMVTVLSRTVIRCFSDTLKLLAKAFI